MTEFKYAKLRGRITEKFGTESAFAKALGVSIQTVSKKLCGASQFKKAEIEKWCELLDIPAKDIGLYFFA